MVNRMTKMNSVVFLQDFQLEVVMSDGRCYLYDMRPKLKTVRFYDLSDWEVFSKGYIKREQMICWDNGSELFVDEIITAGQHR